jgi:omega-amidase
VSDLRITLVQHDTLWHDAKGNHKRIAAQLAPHRGRTDLVVLPETFTTGFSNEAIATAEPMLGASVAWMREQALLLDAAVTGSLQIRDDAGVHNRLVFATPDGDVRQYDKRHLFRMAREHERYVPGGPRLVVEWRGWRICPARLLRPALPGLLAQPRRRVAPGWARVRPAPLRRQLARGAP